MRRLRISLFSIAKSSFCIGLWLIACASFQTQGEHRQFATAPIVDNALDFLYFAIADRAHLEAWFCLHGAVDPRTDNVAITNISPVFVDSADGMNISGRPKDCGRGADSLSVIGTVHFHPDMNQCAFSDVDIITAHWLNYRVEAVVCRDSSNPAPHLLLVYRDQVDSAYRLLPKANSRPVIAPRTFEAVYRYTRPLPPRR